MPRTSRLLRIRTIVRILALALALVLPAGLFLRLDPLAALSVWSLLLLVATMIWGRWFCGWLCPFGVYHQLVSRLLSKWRPTRWPLVGYAAGQRAKYYLLVFLVACLVGGWDAVGWLDPLCLFYRGLGVAQAFEVYGNLATIPASLVAGFIPQATATELTSVSEPARLVLWGSCLTLALLVLVTGLNFFRARFWCRYLCPLGALLAVVAGRSLVELRVNPTACRSCDACSRACPSGAEPERAGRWKASECFSCRSCQELCPSQAIQFRARVRRRQ